MFGKLLLLAIVGLSVAQHHRTHQDEVTDLPGLSFKPNFKHYSGYLKATGNKMFHYWFVESARNPSADPVVLWLNGGPGCSSLAGLLMENGPFMLNKTNASSVIHNPYSWNNVANMIYLESPAGVGFSYSSNKNYSTSDDEVAMDNYAAIKSFFTEYPEFARRAFFLTGESYAGVYIPTLALKIAADKEINFQGFGIGNGLLDDSYNDNSRLYFAYFHGIVGTSAWTHLQTSCKCNTNQSQACDFTGNTSPDCQQAIAVVTSQLDNTGIDPYNVYAECITTSSRSSYETIIPSHRFLYQNNPYVHARVNKLVESGERLKEVPPCANTHDLDVYLNTPAVRAALHIPTEVQAWQICSSEVSAGYHRQYTSMKPQFQKILKMGRYRTILYSGDVDSVCNFMGTEWFADSLGAQLVYPRKAWTYTAADGTNQVAGFVKQFQNLVVVTIRGAGHQVPQDKPIVALKTINNILYPPQ